VTNIGNEPVHAVGPSLRSPTDDDCAAPFGVWSPADVRPPESGRLRVPNTVNSLTASTPPARSNNRWGVRSVFRGVEDSLANQ